MAMKFTKTESKKFLKRLGHETALVEAMAMWNDDLEKSAECIRKHFREMGDISAIRGMEFDLATAIRINTAIGSLGHSSLVSLAVLGYATLIAKITEEEKS